MAPVQVFLKTVGGDTAVLRDVSTIGDLRTAAIAAHSEIPEDGLRLMHASRDIDSASPSACLADFGICEGANVFASLRLLGGGKKRKKKTYTKPKKIKHKHKTVKLAVLKYYKVSDEGKIERLRRECPADECGPGVFMATHADRVCCGKCALTYVHEE